MNYPKNIKAEIVRNGTTQAEISSILGMDKALFNRKINRVKGSRLTIDEAIKLTELLNCTLDEIFLRKKVS